MSPPDSLSVYFKQCRRVYTSYKLDMSCVCVYYTQNKVGTADLEVTVRQKATFTHVKCVAEGGHSFYKSPHTLDNLRTFAFSWSHMAHYRN